MFEVVAAPHGAHCSSFVFVSKVRSEKGASSKGVWIHMREASEGFKIERQARVRGSDIEISQKSHKVLRCTRTWQIDSCVVYS